MLGFRKLGIKDKEILGKIGRKSRKIKIKGMIIGRSIKECKKISRVVFKIMRQI
jgi:hypothetical protein